MQEGLKWEWMPNALRGLAMNSSHTHGQPQVLVIDKSRIVQQLPALTTTAETPWRITGPSAAREE